MLGAVTKLRNTNFVYKPFPISFGNSVINTRIVRTNTQQTLVLRLTAMKVKRNRAYFYLDWFCIFPITFDDWMNIN